VAAGFASERNILRERALMLLDKEPWTKPNCTLMRIDFGCAIRRQSRSKRNLLLEDDHEKDDVTCAHGWGDHQHGGPVIGTGNLFGFRPQSWHPSVLSRLLR
jgi:hypothetical protein